MADSSRILEHLLKTPPTSRYPINYPFLIPNLKGFEAVLSVCEALSSSPTITVKTVEFPPTPPPSPSLDPGRGPMSPTPFPKPTNLSVFLAATDSFSLRNTNCTVAESLARLSPVVKLATSHHIPIRAYVSVVLGCPYDGPDVSPITVAEIVNKLLDMGCGEISLGDTTGMGTAPRTQALFRVLRDAGVPMQRLAGHFHDTYGQALVNCAVALDAGVRVLDSSVAGLGGCPYAKGATGNVATEEVVYFLQSMGVESGVDLEATAEVGEWISGVLGRENGSKVGRALLARKRV
jgi:hydroxymethylglutaryl-CoA lyase